MFTDYSDEGRRGVGVIAIDVDSIGDAALIGDTSGYLGPNPPDISFLLLPVTGTDSVDLAETPLKEGEELAFVGFPMGTDALRAPGWIHQLCPTLQAGLVGAVLPHWSAPIPHGFLLHANTEGGVSGSPVFRKDGTVVGMVYMALMERLRTEDDSGGPKEYMVPTSLTGCIPFNVLSKVLDAAERMVPLTTRQSFQDYVASRQPIEMQAGVSFLDQLDLGDSA